MFPQYPNSIVVVVDGPNADLVDRAAEELTAAIGERPNLFDSVYDPQDMEFFRRNGLLYLDTDELSDLVATESLSPSHCWGRCGRSRTCRGSSTGTVSVPVKDTLRN